MRHTKHYRCYRKNVRNRTRRLTLIAYNAKWDKDNKIDEIIDEYLKHIEDVKPITARQCIKLLPMIAKNKPELKEDIVWALQKRIYLFMQTVCNHWSIRIFKILWQR